jgi:hypothetical protein
VQAAVQSIAHHQCQYRPHTAPPARAIDSAGPSTDWDTALGAENPADKVPVRAFVEHVDPAWKGDRLAAAEFLNEVDLREELLSTAALKGLDVGRRLLSEDPDQSESVSLVDR